MGIAATSAGLSGEGIALVAVLAALAGLAIGAAVRRLLVQRGRAREQAPGPAEAAKLAPAPAPVLIDVVIPAGCYPGIEFTVDYEGREFATIVPQGLRAGDTMTLELPSDEDAVLAMPRAPPPDADAPAGASPSDVWPELAMRSSRREEENNEEHEERLESARATTDRPGRDTPLLSRWRMVTRTPSPLRSRSASPEPQPERDMRLQVV